MYRTLSVTVRNGVQIIRMNRPEKRNAINDVMYSEIPQALNAGAADDNVVVTVLTGAGSFFSSGNDLEGYTKWSGGDIEKIAHEAAAKVQGYVRTFIDYPKILVAVVNGPAIGLAATTLALFDLIYASKSAFFSTPFIELGLTPEGCSSYTYPKVMGTLRAAQMLHFGRKITAAEALEWGLVSEVYSPEEESKVWAKIESLAELPSKSLIYSKRLVRSQDRAALHEANRLECEQLIERWQAEDCMNAVVKFFNRKRNSKL